MRRTRPLLLLSLFPLALTACAGPREAPRVPTPPPPVDEASVKPGINERFLAEDLDVERFVGVFEVESREVALLRDEITASLGITLGSSLADVGAGTGLYLEPFAEAVGQSGTLYAVELSPGFVEHLTERAANEGLAQVRVVQCTEKDVSLPESSVDRAFVCDTYHHFEFPLSVLASLHRALRSGGELVILDFERIPGVSSDWILGHVRAGKDEVRAEVESAGFELLEEVEIEGLAENYVLRFRRP